MGTTPSNALLIMQYLQGIEHIGSMQNAATVAFDCETTGLQPVVGGLRLLQLGALDRLPVVIDCWELEDNGWDAVISLFSQERFWLAHNAVFDLGWLQEHGIYPQGKVLCTMLASRILTNGMPNIKNGLAHVVKRYLSLEISKEQQTSDWSGDLTPEQLEYAAKDVELLVQLDGPINQRMASAGLHRAWFLECAALPAMAQLQRTGLPFDKQALDKLVDDLDDENLEAGEKFVNNFDAALPDNHKLPRDREHGIILYKKEDAERAGTKGFFNLNSPVQLLKKFTALLGKAPLDPKTGKKSASRLALQEYVADHPVVAEYLRWKKLEKKCQMAETLLKNVGKDGFIKASYLQLGADTGRMSCMSPNLQQIPRDSRFRACVVAPAGFKLVVADYAQMELRLAAAEAKDELMIRAFQDGTDLHTLTAMQLYGVDEDSVTKDQRQIAKSANFGLLYGSGAKGLRNYAASTGVQMDLDEAAEIREKFHAAYKGISQWQRKNAAAANAASGLAPIYIRHSGLRRFLPGEHNKLTTRCNTPIQGAGAAVLKRTLGKLWPLLKADGEDIVRLAGVVHDEVILLVKEEHAETWAHQLTAVMEEAEAEWLDDVPPLAEAKVGDTWNQAK